MGDQQESNQPNWLDEFEDLANEQLEEGSSCEEIHPIVAAWYEEVMAGEPPASRDSVLQAMHCLTTEAMNDMPQAVTEVLSGRDLDDELAEWVTELLLVGRAFQIALENGRLDDL